MKKVLLVSAITLSAMLVAPSQTSSDQAKKSPVEGTWEFVAAPRLSPPRKEIKIILGGHFVFARYNAETGNLIYAGGGTYTLNSTSYTEHVDFMSQTISKGLVGKDQPFTVTVEGDTLSQTGTMTDGSKIHETWKRIN
jgi:hypothetical protein